MFTPQQPEGSSSSPASLGEGVLLLCQGSLLSSPHASSSLGISSWPWLPLLPGHQGVSNSRLRPSPALLQPWRANHLLDVSSGTSQGHPRPATSRTEPPVSPPDPGAPLESVVSEEAPSPPRTRAQPGCLPCPLSWPFSASCRLHIIASSCPRLPTLVQPSSSLPWVTPPASRSAPGNLASVLGSGTACDSQLANEMQPWDFFWGG